MKILLCSPNTDKPVVNQAGRLPPLTGICPPLGIGYLASSARAAGHEVVLYDFVKCPDAEIEAAIRREAPDVAGISCFTLTRGAALDVARIARKVNPAIHTVLGGSHATALAEQMLAHYPEVDAIVLGEGERSFVEWLEALGGGRAAGEAPAGVAVREGGSSLAERAEVRTLCGSGGRESGPRIRVNRRTDFLDNLDALPFPERRLANRPPYKPFPERYRAGRQAALMASRGCPYRCQFCSTSVYWGNRYRIRSVPNVVEEVKQIVEQADIDDLEILDDAFTVKKDWTLAFCREVRRLGFRFDWHAVTRANYLDEELCREMRKAGCRGVILGIESFSDAILKRIHKGVTQAQAVAGIRAARKAGLEASCLLMVGNPGETWETIRDNVEVIRRLRLRTVTVNLTQVYPETELYEISKKGGLVDDAYWLDESRGAPIFTLENPVERLQEYVAAIQDAQWANRPLVRLYRASGLRKLKRWIKGRRNGKEFKHEDTKATK